MINLQNLVNNQSNGAGGGSAKDKAFYFDGSNDYIAGNGNLGNGVAIAGSDGNGQYMQCYNTGFNVGPLSIDNRSVQTIKWRGSFDTFATAPFLFSYWNGSVGLTSVKVQANGTIQVEVQGTGSGRITTTGSILIETEYNIIIRVNNTLPTGTARVVGDVDIFVNGVKQTLGFSATGNNTTTASQAYWGAYSTTLGMTGKMRSLDIWNVALTDGECGTEGVSSSVVNTTGYLKGFRPNDVRGNLGRNGYDLTVLGNVSTGSDSDGSYIYFNGNKTATPIGTASSLKGTTTPVFDQTTSFSLSVKVKVNVLPSGGNCGIYGSNFDAGLSVNNTGNFVFGLRGSSTVQNSYAMVVGTIYTLHLVYDANVAKFYCYINGTLQNAGGTAGPTTFSTNDRYIGDNAISGGTVVSAPMFVYHCTALCKAMTQTEVTADIALGNTTKTDKAIIAYYIPENLAYNVQYMLNPKDLSTGRSLSGTSSVIADTTVAPDGTTTADTLTIIGTATQGIEQSNLTISGSALASKTLIVKAFVKVTAGTALFRLKMTHRTVADYFSSNLTATTDRQEFTFTQTFTSGTGGTGITAGIVNDSGATNPILLVRNVRSYITNESLFDESPNIAGYIGWKTNKVYSLRFKPNADNANDPTAGNLIHGPRGYLYDRGTDHSVNIRYDDRYTSRASIASVGVAGFRDKAHIVGCIFWNGTAFATKIYLNGVLVDSNAGGLYPPGTLGNATVWLGRHTSTYNNVYMQGICIYTGTITDADAVLLYQGAEPATAVKVLEYKPKASETGLVTKDRANNNNNGQLLGGVERRNL